MPGFSTICWITASTCPRRRLMLPAFRPLIQMKKSISRLTFVEKHLSKYSRFVRQIGLNLTRLISSLLRLATESTAALTYLVNFFHQGRLANSSSAESKDRSSFISLTCFSLPCFNWSYFFSADALLSASRRFRSFRVL